MLNGKKERRKTQWEKSDWHSSKYFPWLSRPVPGYWLWGMGTHQNERKEGKHPSITNCNTSAPWTPFTSLKSPISPPPTHSHPPRCWAREEELENKASNQRGLHFQSGVVFYFPLHSNQAQAPEWLQEIVHRTHMSEHTRDGFALRLFVMWLPALLAWKSHFPDSIFCLLGSHRTLVGIFLSQCLLQCYVSQFRLLKESNIHWKAYPQQKPISDKSGVWEGWDHSNCRVRVCWELTSWWIPPLESILQIERGGSPLTSLL